jgi:RNA polymerase sigma-70 factor, ECF subfamily
VNRMKPNRLEKRTGLVKHTGNKQPAVDLGEFLDGLYGYAVVLSRSVTEAEDLVQETCLRAIQSMGRLRPDSNVKSWLFTILRNIWLNHVRRLRKGGMVALNPDRSEANDPIDTAKDAHTVYVGKIEREQVRAAIRQLPVEFREIVILREYEELSYQEIATLLACPIGTVMSRLARARSRLRDLLPAASLALPSERNGGDDPTRSPEPLSSRRRNKPAAQVSFRMSAREIRATDHKEPVSDLDMSSHHDILSRR